MLPVPRRWSDLTPAWLTAALAPHFPGAQVARVEVGDVADGTNRRARLFLRYRAGTGPATVFVKREGRVLNRLALVALGALQSEARLFGSGVPLPLDHPHPYAAAVDARRLATVVVMEDVTLHGAAANQATAALTADQVLSGLRGLASLHAAYWQRPLPRELRFVRPWRLNRIWAPVSWASLARAERLLRAMGHRHLLPATARPAVLEPAFRRWATIATTVPQTLLHGDPHPGNTYTRPDATIGFYDWQLVRAGSWVHDVGYFLVASLGVADRRRHEAELLRAYLAELAGHGVAPPPFEDALALYRQSAAYGLGAWLHTLSGGGFQPVDLCLVTIERFAAAYADHLGGSHFGLLSP